PSLDNIQVIPFPELNLGVCRGVEPSGVPDGSVALSPPMMLPTLLDVDDNGQFKVRTATGKFEDMNIRDVKGKVNVNLLAIGRDVLDGAISITQGQVHFVKEKGKT
ncbi:MAG TPA: hypothetical protein VFA32_21595, partial [Dehalococcoidia bacterium]|nr:hypothetical protein [Dehalococcoidia bacterium]